MSIMLPQPPDENPPPRSETPAAPATITRPTGTHWYVESVFSPGYCAACNCPRANRRRHIERAA